MAIFTACADGELDFVPEEPPVPSIVFPHIPTDLKIPDPDTMELIRECPTAISCNNSIRNLDIDTLRAAMDAIEAENKADEQEKKAPFSPLQEAVNTNLFLLGF